MLTILAGLVLYAQVAVETKPVTMEAVQFKAEYVNLVTIQGNGSEFPIEYFVAAPGHAGKLPQKVLTHLFRYSDGSIGMWADGSFGEPYTGTTTPLRDGDWIVFRHEWTVVYSQEVFKKSFTIRTSPP